MDSLPLLVAGAGLLLALVHPLHVAFRLRVNVGALTQQLTKLVRSGNTERALKLVRCLPGHPLLEAFRALFERALKPGWATSTELSQVFLAEQGPRLRPFDGTRMAARLGLLLALGAVGLAFTRGTLDTPALWGLSGLTLFASEGTVSWERRVALDTAQALQEVIAALLAVPPGRAPAPPVEAEPAEAALTGPTEPSPGADIAALAADLERLHGLLVQGILTQAEFDTQKAERLARRG